MRRSVTIAVAGLVGVLALAPSVGWAAPDPTAARHNAPYVKGQLIVKFKSSLRQCAHCLLEKKQRFGPALQDASASLDRLNQRYRVKKARSLFVPRHELSTFEAQAKERARFEKATSHLKARRVSIPPPPDLTNVYVLELPEDVNIEEAVQTYQADPHVEYAEPNYLLDLQAFPATPPNDTYVDPDQNGTWSTGAWGQSYEDLWGAKKIQADKAWAISQGEGVVVAVIDSGVDYNHEDLAANIWTNPLEIAGNGKDDDNNGYVDDVRGFDFWSSKDTDGDGRFATPGVDTIDADPMDENGHGTHVAGTIAAVGNNGKGIIGIAPKAKIMALKIGGAGREVSAEAGALAITYAANHGARVLNNSWGGRGSSNLLSDAFNYAYSKGCVSVAAAGNKTANAGDYVPASIDTVIAVSATTPKDERASFSNYGNVDLAAPGGGGYSNTDPLNILSTMPDSATIARTSPKVSSGYHRLAGTSMASPHVAGAAALLLSAHPAFSPEDVRGVLKMSADPVSPPPGVSSPDGRYMGQGRLNAASASSETHRPPVAILKNRQGLISGKIDIRGLAMGQDFCRYTLSYGTGSSWTTIRQSVVPVTDDLATPNPTDGMIYQGFDTVQLPEGEIQLRLAVETCSGRTLEDRLLLTVQNVVIRSPMALDVYRKGERLSIEGDIRTPFQSYSIEYGFGMYVDTWSSNNWQNAGVTLTHTAPGTALSGSLATLDTSVLPVSSHVKGNFLTIRLRVNTSWGAFRDAYAYVVYVDPKLKQGWPQRYPTGATATNSIPVREAGFIVADLDGNGTKEIIAAYGEETAPSPFIRAYRATGDLWWSREFPCSASGVFVPVVGDLDRDGRQEIYVNCTPRGSNTDTIYALRFDGTDIGGPWPRVMPRASLRMIIADVDADGRPELIARSAVMNSPLLLVINRDAEVVTTISLPGSNTSRSEGLFPSVGNFDSDAALEIVTAQDVHDVAVYNADGSLVAGWPVSVGKDQSEQSPVVGDLDGDGYDNVLVVDSQGILYAFDRDGRMMPGWPSAQRSRTTPALGDLNNDGTLEIATAGLDGDVSTVVVLDSRGRLLPGWPQATNNESLLYQPPTLGDVNGDGRPDVLAAAGGVGRTLYIDIYIGTRWSASGGVWAWTASGVPIDLNAPEGTPGPYLITERGAFPSVILEDIDNDGQTDLLTSSFWDQEPAPSNQVTSKARRSIYVWSLPRTYQPSHVPWPMFRHDPQRTGRYIPPTPPAVPSALRVTASYNAPIGTKLNVIWTDNAVNETGFAIERWVGSAGLWTQVATVGASRYATAGYEDSGLTPDTRYYYRVRAFNARGFSAYCPSASGRTLPLPPAAPSMLAITGTTPTTVTLAWKDNATNEMGIYIERAPSAGWPFLRIKTVSANTTSYTDSTVSPWTTYSYRVQAYNFGGASAYSNTVRVQTLDGTPPTAPTFGSVSLASGALQSSWTTASDPESGIAEYQYALGTSAGSSDAIPWTSTGLTTYVRRAVTIPTGRTYYLSVRAKNRAGMFSAVTTSAGLYYR